MNKLQFKKWSKIPQYRSIIQSIQMNHDFVGKDDLDNPIYKHTSDYPTIEFKGTIKIHGTNAQISYKKGLPIQVGKRSSLIEQDRLGGHFGFNQFVQVDHQQEFIDWFKVLDEKYNLSDDEQLIIYGEWAGNGVQSGVAIGELPKAFYIFGAQVLKDGKVIHLSVQDLPDCPVSRVFNIHEFPVYEMSIDFNNPKASQNKLIELTLAVEELCPVADKQGVKGIGEGIVWRGFYKDQFHTFKVKGKKHSSGNKVKTLAEIDPAVLQNIQDFVTHVVTEGRVKQAIHELQINSRQDTGKFLKWISEDILAEELDTLNASDLQWSEVNKAISRRARLMYFLEIDKL
jgi:hypothetical protein